MRPGCLKYALLLSQFLPQFFCNMGRYWGKKKNSCLNSFFYNSKFLFILHAGKIKLINGIDQLHNSAYCSIKMESILNIMSHLLYGSMRFKAKFYQPFIKSSVSIKRFYVFKDRKMICYHPPDPIEEPEGTFYPLVTPIQIFLRWSREETE